MFSIFDQYFKKYDTWYEKNKFTYLSELKLLSKLVPKDKKGLEIGVGTGRFAESLGIKYGIDPSVNMLKIAKGRGVKIKKASGENVPFKDNVFEYVVIVITLAFVNSPQKVIKEAWRVLNNNGKIIIGIVDSNSFLADFYRNKEGAFYKEAKFVKVNQLTQWLKAAGFYNLIYYQTLFNLPRDMNEIEKPRSGFGQGGFVAVIAGKNISHI